MCTEGSTSVAHIMCGVCALGVFMFVLAFVARAMLLNSSAVLLGQAVFTAPLGV